MQTNEVLALINAGFTKSEILALAGVQATQPAEVTNTQAQTVPAQIKEAEPIKATVEPQPEVKATETAAAAVPVMSDAQVEKLAQLLNVNAATIDVPPTRTVDDALAERFKNVMLGK